MNAARWQRMRRALSRGEWASLGGMAGCVILLHLIGWGVLIALVVPQQLSIGSAGLFGVGIGLTAYTLGLRHAFDADHIAAIDNTTRKLMNDGRHPLSVGFWFSLGHSTIVFGLCALLAAGIRALAGPVEEDSSTLQSVLGVIGTGISGSFLYLIGIINLVILLSIVKVFRRMRHGEFDEAALEDQLANRGFANRIFGRATRVVTRPWQMYPIGLLFGLGFDTATEVSLLILAGGAAAFVLPWYAILTLPILFAAGMSLLDSLDGIFMNYAYGWAFTKPVRKVYYNLVITAVSVAVALVIGSIELLSILVDQIGIVSGPLYAIGSLNLENVGYVIIAICVLAWIIAFAGWRLGHVEERWSAAVRPAPTDTD
ncbi:HoxN/HupN/NixA family nickel/cobalt transporter [Cryobacterium melibiosiphilum]|uniref:Nickel/cobalt efflux system n=1 Tax=Cryobacterium melibiosiphilum TaxID=995039 RepID=A0A3A5MGX4_9MICO|nr:HoxN/HupN/NixA family nickel/cobalt transporter [Cryobacterium melibiosiphilum]RJT88658.1 HoxN/HupN/NixA family nickel/cobalt transporter [Cryobacterium melibiosiphilum]RJT89420.1 HoxN/HupN/NixA family nickel/cobalt transporter [Cryobacterium melibiosiphilum]